MPWFKVDDGFHAHRKVARLGREDFDAVALWTVAGSWSADQLTDGWVPEYVAAKLDPDYERRAKALVRVGLWELAQHDGEPGWVFHGWSDPGRNPTAEQVEKEREATAERQRKFRERVKGTGKSRAPDREPPPEATSDDDASNAVTNGGVAPLVTLPVPFRSVPFLSMEETTTSPSEPAAPDSDSPPDIDPPAAKAKRKPRRDTTGERPDVDALCNRLAELMSARGLRTPSITQTWRDEARRLLDLDRVNDEPIPFTKALRLLEWSQGHHFWHKNIHSIPKFREQYDRLRDEANSEWQQGHVRAEPGTELERPNLQLLPGGAAIPPPRISATARAFAEADAAGEEVKRLIYGSTG